MMRNETIREYLKIFRCPDDAGQLLLSSDHLRCGQCQRIFPILAENVVELLPMEPYPLEQGGQDYYRRLLQQEFKWDPDAQGWGGNLSIASSGRKGFVSTELSVIGKYLAGNIENGLLLDVCGGAGNYSLYYANRSKLVVHNDLDVGSLNHVYRQSNSLAATNVLICRGDYHKLPFASDTFDAVICTGHSLTRGNVSRPLVEIIRCIKTGGRFAVDFPNEARHLPLFPRGKNTGSTISYRRDSLPMPEGAAEIAVIGIHHVPAKFVPFASAYALLDKVFRLLRVPPSTFILLGRKG